MATPRAGTEVFLQVQLNDMSQTSRPLFDPANGVTLLLKNPSNVIILNDVTMTRASQGIYTYRYQTTTASPRGRWMGRFKATDGSAIHYSHDLEMFTMVAT